MSQLSTLQSLMDLYARTNSPDYQNNRTAWINEAQRQICRMERWWFTEFTSSFSVSAGNSGPYTISEKVAFLNGVWFGGLELRPINLAAVPMLPISSGTPLYFRLDGLSSFYIYPPSSTSGPATVYGHKFLADLANPTDTNALVQTAPYALIFGAMIEAALHLGRDPSVWKARFDWEVALLKSQSPRGRVVG